MIVIGEIYRESVNACSVYENQITHSVTVLSDKVVTETYLCCGEIDNGHCDLVSPVEGKV